MTPDEVLSFRGRALPPQFAARTVVLDAGTTHPVREPQWAGTLVVVEEGLVEVRCRAGGRRMFRGGDVLWLAGIDAVALHNPGPGSAVLVAVRRRTAP